MHVPSSTESATNSRSHEKLRSARLYSWLLLPSARTGFLISLLLPDLCSPLLALLVPDPLSPPRCSLPTDRTHYRISPALSLLLRDALSLNRIVANPVVLDSLPFNDFATGFSESVVFVLGDSREPMDFAGSRTSADGVEREAHIDVPLSNRLKPRLHQSSLARSVSGPGAGAPISQSRAFAASSSRRGSASNSRTANSNSGDTATITSGSGTGERSSGSGIVSPETDLRPFRLLSRLSGSA